MKTFLRKVLPVLVLLTVVAIATYLKEFAGVAQNKAVVVPVVLKAQAMVERVAVITPPP